MQSAVWGKWWRHSSSPKTLRTTTSHSLWPCPYLLLQSRAYPSPLPKSVSPKHELYLAFLIHAYNSPLHTPTWCPSRRNIKANGPKWNYLPTPPPHPSTRNLGIDLLLINPLHPTKSQFLTLFLAQRYLSSILLTFWLNCFIYTFTISWQTAVISPNCLFTLELGLFKCISSPNSWSDLEHLSQRGDSL